MVGGPGCVSRCRGRWLCWTILGCGWSWRAAPAGAAGGAAGAGEQASPRGGAGGGGLGRDAAAGAPATLRTHLMRLRRAVRPQEATRIGTSGRGHLIGVDEAELDVLQFDALCREASCAAQASAWAQVSEAARRALALWRAAPLADVPSQILPEEFAPGWSNCTSRYSKHASRPCWLADQDKADDRVLALLA